MDDRPNELHLLIEILRAARCRISVAFDGAQAYNRAQLIAPDLILMDVRMPRMGGYEATAELRTREEPLGGHTPIVDG